MKLLISNQSLYEAPESSSSKSDPEEQFVSLNDDIGLSLEAGDDEVTSSQETGLERDWKS
jgi:hypothetical protein